MYVAFSKNNAPLIIIGEAHSVLLGLIPLGSGAIKARLNPLKNDGYPFTKLLEQNTNVIIKRF